MSQAAIICFDCSELMRNTDWQPSRWHAQHDAINLISSAKLQQNSNNSIGLIAMYPNSQTKVAINLTNDIKKIASSLATIQFGDHSAQNSLSHSIDILSAIKTASLLLRHRKNKKQEQKIILFIGSPIIKTINEKSLLQTTVRFICRDRISFDVINFGECDANKELLTKFINLGNHNNCHLITAKPNGMLSDILISTPIFNHPSNEHCIINKYGDESKEDNDDSDSSDDAESDSSDDDEEESSGDFAEVEVNAKAIHASQAGQSFGGIDPNTDPELCMALRSSLEEPRQRQERTECRTECIGLAIGGAGDVNNFRKCIENNIMPSIDSITYNGLLNEYYFDTKTRKHKVFKEEHKENKDDGSNLFYPTYCYAKTKKLMFLENDDEKQNLLRGSEDDTHSHSLAEELGIDEDDEDLLEALRMSMMSGDDINDVSEQEMNVLSNNEQQEDEIDALLDGLPLPSINEEEMEELLKAIDDDIDDVDDEYEYYMTVGLNSNIKQSEFKRKHLNLVVLWDISGSMSGLFEDDKNNADIDIDRNGKWRNTLKVNDKIYAKDYGKWYIAEIVEIYGTNSIKIHYIGYDTRFDKFIETNSYLLAPYNEMIMETKMHSAKKAIKSILNQLTPKDRLGIITFNSNGYVMQKLQFINDINMDVLNKNIENMISSGGTNFEKGYKKSMEIYQELFNDEEYKLNTKNDEYDNRIIIITDAQPNEGISSSNKLLNLIQKYAENKQDINDIDNNMDDYIHDRVYTTFIGVGLDFNTSLIERICKTRGCNYFSVKTTKQFDNKMNEEFDNMVTPLVFNVCLKIKCEGNSCRILKVYGMNNNKEREIMNKGEITRIDTLFPSKRCVSTGDIKGGIQLIKLGKMKGNNNDNINVELEVVFEDRNGKKYENIQNVTLNTSPKMVNDMIENDEKEIIDFYDNIGIRKGILLCKYVDFMRKWIEMDGNNSYQSSLNVSYEFKNKFTDFIQHFKEEMICCNDDTLQKEIDIMQKLINQ